MAMLAKGPYKLHQFQLVGLKGLSEKQIDVHLKLYAGYVTNVNTLNDKLAAMSRDGKIGTPEWAEVTRRLGFEYDGMVLHEYYFGNLKAGGSELQATSPVGAAIAESFGSIEAWMADFRGIAMMRGVGWAVLFQDPVTGWLSNHWLSLHQEGAPVGFKPILALDVWEHAFLIDYVPAERPKYIDAFFANVDWGAAEQRLVAAGPIRPIG
jgi:superoxide dismutase, Fe-Mn family